MQFNVPTDENFIIHTLPQLPALNVAVQFPPMIAQLATPLISLMITDIQNHRGMSYVRAAYHSRMSQNFYQNQDFGRVGQFAADLAELMISQGTHPDQAVAQAAQEAVQITMAIFALQNPQLYPLMDQQTVADFQALQQRGQTYKGHIQNMQMMRQPTGYGHQMPMTGGVQGGGLPQGLSGPMQSGGYTGMQSSIGSTGRPSRLETAPSQIAGSATPWTPNVNANATSVGTGGATVRAPGRYDMTGITMEDDPGNNTQANQRAVTGVMNVPPGAVGSVNAVQVGTSKVAAPAAPENDAGFTWGAAPKPTTPAAPHAAAAPSPTRQYEPVADMVTKPNDLVQAGLDSRPFDCITTPDGMMITPAGLNYVKFTGTSEMPYQMAYDPAKYLLTYVKTPDGIVQESLVEWNPQMDYLDHELNGSLAANERQRRLIQSGKKVASGWVLAQALTPNWNNTMSTVDEDAIAGLPENADLVDMEITPYSADPEDVIVVDTLTSGIRKGTEGLKLAGAPGIDKTSIEMYLAIPQLFVFSSEEWANKAAELANADSLDELHERLSAFKDMDDEDVLSSLDMRITAAINSALTDGMSMSQWSIDSFLNDWSELKSELVGQFGSQEMLDILMENSTSIIDATFSRMDSIATRSYLTELDFFDPSHAEAQESANELLELASDEDAAAASEKAGLENPDSEGGLPEATETETTEVVESAEEASEGDQEDAEEFIFPNVVVFVDRVSVTTIPQTREEISLRLDTGCLIVPEYQPALHAAVSAIFARTMELKMVYKHRYIMTADRKFLEVKRGLLTDSALLIFDRGELY